MNSLGGREWELYNFDQIGASTEYDNILINKDIDNYFNDLISKPVSNQNSFIIKSNYNFEKFYSEYIEHNMLFIVLLIGIIIFLVIRYYIKDFDNNENKLNLENYSDTNSTDYNNNLSDSYSDSDSDNVDKIINNKKFIKKNKLEKNKIQKMNQIKRKQQIEKIQLLKYKKQLDKEKEKILSIIDELSNLNSNEYTNSQPYPNYLGQDININYGTNYSNSQRFFNQAQDNLDNLDRLAHNHDDHSEYYDINKNIDDDTNKIDGLYIEPPFN